MTLQYIRIMYGVPAVIGQRVEHNGAGEKTQWTIIGARNARLRVMLDGHTVHRYFHPTWNIQYLDEQSESKIGKWTASDSVLDGDA